MNTTEASNSASKKCFVCGKTLDNQTFTYNKKTNLPVCDQCKGTPQELKAEKDALDTLSEGFVCGCI